MDPYNIYNKYEEDFKKNFNPDFLSIKYHNSNKPTYVIIYDGYIKPDDISKKIPFEWLKIAEEKIIDIIISPHPLTIFERHAEDLDDFYDDSLFIRYQNIDKPTFDIQYGDDCDPIDIRKNLPQSWLSLEKYDVINIVIRECELPENHQSDILSNLKEEFMSKLDKISKSNQQS